MTTQPTTPYDDGVAKYGRRSEDGVRRGGYRQAKAESKQDLLAALERIDSLIHELPRSATAEAIHQTATAAIAKTKGEA